MIDWIEMTDDDENSYLEGMSPYTGDSDPCAVPDIAWRLRQRLFDNRIVWYADHDGELGGETGDAWDSLEDAKAEIQVAHDHILRTECDEVENA